METVQVLKIDTNPAQTSIKDLRNQLKAFKDEMAGLEEGSDAFLEVATKAGAVKHQIDEITQTVNGASADFGDMLGNATGALNGIIGGFTAAQGALSFFGLESEEVVESIKKLQSLMAVGQGIAQIDNGVKALKKLNSAIVGTSKSAKILKAALQPKVFAAVSVAVLGLSLVFNKLKKSEDDAKAAADAYAQSVKDKETKAIEDANKALEHNLTLKERVYKIRYSGDDVKVYTALLNDYQKNLDDVNEQIKDKYNDSILLSLKAQERQLNQFLETLEVGSAEYTQVLVDITGLQDQISKVQPKTEQEMQRLYDLQTKYTEKVNETTTALNDAKIIAQETAKLKSAEEETKRQSELNKLYEDSVTLLESYVREKEKLVAPELPQEEEELDYITQRLLDTYNNFRNSVADSYTSLLMTDEQYFDASERALKESLQLKLISQQEYNDAVKRLHKEQAEYEISNYLQVANDVADILNSVADTQDSNNKEGFERAKKLQISAATIQMLTGITAAISGAFTTHTGVWDIVLAATQAASIAASGIANIKKIQAQTYNGTSTSTPTTTLSGNVTNTLTAPVEYSTAIEGAKTRSTIQNNRVYVLESDIRNTGTAVNVAESESRY